MSYALDAAEKQRVAMAGIPEVFMQTDVNKLIFMHIEGKMVGLLVRTDLEQYTPIIFYIGNRKFIYIKILKAQYGKLQTNLLFFENFSKFLVNKFGFVISYYNLCVPNKIINRQQCTVTWNVNNLKISQWNQAATEAIIKDLNDKYGHKEPSTSPTATSTPTWKWN